MTQPKFSVERYTVHHFAFSPSNCGLFVFFQHDTLVASHCNKLYAHTMLMCALHYTCVD